MTSDALCCSPRSRRSRSNPPTLMLAQARYDLALIQHEVLLAQAKLAMPRVEDVVGP